jgi:3-methyl-2-oxobutanoate hydroxymethyltransferase
MPIPPDLEIKFHSGVPLSMLTAYDAPTAKMLHESGIDIVLVGDSVGRAVLGYSSEREVTLSDMIHHVKAVRRGAHEAYLLADLPFNTYRDREEALVHTRALIEAGASAVKMEGPSASIICHMAENKIDLCVHLGLQPQHHDGFKIQGKTAAEAFALVQDALTAEKMGASLLLLELVPEEVSQAIASRTSIPVIGIGAGRNLGGQVLVVNDILGITERSFRHNQIYAQWSEIAREAARHYAQDVAQKTFPDDTHISHIKEEEKSLLDELLKNLS